jgi:cyclopropane fatty-acyl-phospholipid synthase-like methyltransferase
VNGRHTVEAGYDRMAEQYLRARHTPDPITRAALDELARGLPKGGTALDLGCGAGVPVTQWLAQRFVTTGVDVSARQLELARRHVPGATLIKGSMTDVEFAPQTFDAVVAFHSIIHVPRTEQPALLRRIHAWLKPGGLFLATWAVRAWEGEEQDWEGWGAPMWWSHYDAQTNLTMLSDAGFHIDSAETRTGDGETWLWVLARK